jgi:hypothetical protein
MGVWRLESGIKRDAEGGDLGGEAELFEGVEGEPVEAVAVGVPGGGEFLLGHVGGLFAESGGAEGETAEGGVGFGAGHPGVGEGLGEGVVFIVGG